MNFSFYLMLSIIFLLHSYSATCLQGSKDHQHNQHYATDCGIRPARREPRDKQNSSKRMPKIIAGLPTKEGQFPWQASLELLHPSMGFLGHWCGAVLIHRYWVLSAAHCIHNDLFNLPLPPLWTVVLGEYNREIESGYEQRIPVEKIVLHKRYHNFLHDLVLMKLSIPADLAIDSNIRRICLPFIYNEAGSMQAEWDDDDAVDAADSDNIASVQTEDALDAELAALPEKADNFLRSVQNMRRHRNVTLPSMKELMSSKIVNRLRQAQGMEQNRQDSAGPRVRQRTPRSMQFGRRRNDKLMKVNTAMEAAEYAGLIEQQRHKDQQDYNELPYSECVATGWGKANVSGDLTDILLKTNVPLHDSNRCKDAYGSFVKIHRGHLCAGKLNGKGGTCVGDSGGPLQCRLNKNSPWILAGITSFGSGCAIKGFPDVYTRTSFYMKWIQNTIAYE